MKSLYVCAYIVPSPVMSSDEAWRFCEKRSRSIEVFYTNEEDEKVLTRVHFQYDKEVSVRSSSVVQGFVSL